MTLYPDLADIRTVFEDTVNELGGTIRDPYHRTETLFLRAVLPEAREVQPRDTIGHGLALRTRGHQVVVHPYSFRQVCQNGAIHISNIASRTIDRASSLPGGFPVLNEIRDALRACGTSEAFEENISQMSELLSREVEMPLLLSGMMSRLGDSAFAVEIMNHFLEHEDRSMYGMMNAVTARARDEPDPERRWNLEELGGGMLALLDPPNPRLRPGAVRGLRKSVDRSSLEAVS